MFANERQVQRECGSRSLYAILHGSNPTTRFRVYHSLSLPVSLWLSLCCGGPPIPVKAIHPLLLRVHKFVALSPTVKHTYITLEFNTFAETPSSLLMIHLVRPITSRDDDDDDYNNNNKQFIDPSTYFWDRSSHTTIAVYSPPVSSYHL